MFLHQVCLWTIGLFVYGSACALITVQSTGLVKMLKIQSLKTEVKLYKYKQKKLNCKRVYRCGSLPARYRVTKCQILNMIVQLQNLSLYLGSMSTEV